MKQTILKAASLFLFFLLCSCTKDLYDPGEKIPGGGENPFGNTRVPADFDWSTLHSARLKVETYDNFDGG